MAEVNWYLFQLLRNYDRPHPQLIYPHDINGLKATLKQWAGTCYLDILESGSYARGTATAFSDLDYLVSLKSDCNKNSGGWQSIHSSLYDTLRQAYRDVRQQNASIRVTLNGIEIDVTPAKKFSGNTHYHSLYVSKLKTWRQTNIQKHINTISQSNRTDEIKLLKIWRDLNNLDFPSIYLEYLIVDHILSYKPTGPSRLAENFWHVLLELAKYDDNPLFDTLIDPANSCNPLSDLLTNEEKQKIIYRAREATNQTTWESVIW